MQHTGTNVPSAHTADINLNKQRTPHGLRADFGIFLAELRQSCAILRASPKVRTVFPMLTTAVLSYYQSSKCTGGTQCTQIHISAKHESYLFTGNIWLPYYKTKLLMLFRGILAVCCENKINQMHCVGRTQLLSTHTGGIILYG
jgi:hypothetical protein